MCSNCQVLVVILAKPTTSLFPLSKKSDHMHRLFYSPRLHPLIKFHCSTFINVPHIQCQGCSHKFLYSEQPPHVPAGYLFPEKDSAAARFPNFPLKNGSHLNCMCFLVYTITRHWVYNAYLEMASNQKHSKYSLIKINKNSEQCCLNVKIFFICSSKPSVVLISINDYLHWW